MSFRIIANALPAGYSCLTVVFTGSANLSDLVRNWMEDPQHHKPIRTIKAHSRRARSLFRYGFDLLRRFFIDPLSFSDSLFQPIQLLSCT